jgi:hypothetical protein
MAAASGNGSTQELQDLLAHARQAGTRSGDLDEIVHEVVSWRATEINNRGLEAQLRYLTGTIGPAQTRELLQAGPDGNEEQPARHDTHSQGETP